MWRRLLPSDPDRDRVAQSILQLTAIVFLLRPFEVWWLAPFALAAAVLCLVVEPVRQAPVTWVLLAGLAFGRVVALWPLGDNHHYLLAYWCLAIALALGGPTPAATLATSGRWLLAAAFALAVLWKGVLSPDYTDGRFFRVTLLTDGRFTGASMLIGGLTPEQMARNREFLEPLPEGAELLLEAAIAILCALPSGGRVRVARHAALLVFCVTTYALAPVAGFGWLIAALGLAQCSPQQRMLRGAYIAVVVLILVDAEFPWSALLSEARGRGMA